MHSKSNNIEIMINDKADEVIEKIFESILNKYQIRLETSLLYYKCHKIHFKQGGLYIGSPDWIKNKKATTNYINKKNNTFNTL